MRLERMTMDKRWKSIIGRRKTLAGITRNDLSMGDTLRRKKNREHKASKASRLRICSIFRITACGKFQISAPKNHAFFSCFEMVHIKYPHPVEKCEDGLLIRSG